MWRVGRTLITLGYFMPILWVGWILTQPGDASPGSGVLLIAQLIGVVGASLLSLVCGTVTAAIGWRQSAEIRPVMGYLTVGLGALGATALLGALLWAQLTLTR